MNPLSARAVFVGNKRRGAGGKEIVFGILEGLQYSMVFQEKLFI